ncbi:thaumatin-like protein 1 [Phragmites australis]|uniref:thaumatin-like protein 1 n=1 Tax=Phragmites australis TaxID=29695 RepID=UPI002D77A692|nr:thaumatin-like protein 1 [Phragmites australis]
MAPLTSSLASAVSLSLVILSFFQDAVADITFTFTNRCGGTVWPGVLANSGSSPLQTTGFTLGAGETRSLTAPAGWSGRFWARTGCAFDASGKGACATGDCGAGEVECRGKGAAPPATLVEFTLNGSGGKDYYDVSLVDGYNLPMVVEAAAPGCPATGCLVDLNERCPAELRAGQGQAQACRSACEAFGRPEYCCSGQFSNPDTCRPSVYSQMFKTACPRSYSYAYDDATSTFTCTGTDYSITFCPRAGRQKSTNDPSPRPSEVQLESDSWLASLATGELDGAATASTAASLLLQGALAAAAVMALLL